MTDTKTERKIIGEGAFGIVYEVGPHKVEKVFRSPQRLAAEILSEIAIMQHLSAHPNIMGASEVKFNLPDSVSIVMERADYSLHDKTTTSGMPEAMIRNVLFGIASGMQYANSKGILHGDLHVKNILMMRDGSIKIADWGVAQMINNSNPKFLARKFFMSQISYIIAPELNLDIATYRYCHKIDVWSFGIMTLLTRGYLDCMVSHDGALTQIVKLIGPINERDWPEVAHSRDYKKFVKRHMICNNNSGSTSKFIHNMSPDLIDLLTKCLVYNPMRRASWNDILTHRFFNIMFITKEVTPAMPTTAATMSMWQRYRIPRNEHSEIPIDERREVYYKSFCSMFADAKKYYREIDNITNVSFSTFMHIVQYIFDTFVRTRGHSKSGLSIIECKTGYCLFIGPAINIISANSIPEFTYVGHINRVVTIFNGNFIPPPEYQSYFIPIEPDYIHPFLSKYDSEILKMIDD